MKTTQRLTSTNQLSQNRVIGMQSYPVYQSLYFLKRPQYIHHQWCKYVHQSPQNENRVDNVHFFKLRNCCKKKCRQSSSSTASLKTQFFKYCKVKFGGIIFLFVLNLSFNHMVFAYKVVFSVSKNSISALCPEYVHHQLLQFFLKKIIRTGSFKRSVRIFFWWCSNQWYEQNLIKN